MQQVSLKFYRVDQWLYGACLRILIFGLSFIAIFSGVLMAQSVPSSIIAQKDQAVMILIPEGAFEFGIDRPVVKKLVKRLKSPWLENIHGQEFKKETKSLSAFYIDKYEVTNEQYKAFVKATKHRDSHYSKWPQFNEPKQPVVGVGWADAESYCVWAGKRLPSEEEWEKAARGSDGRLWPWGNIPNDLSYNGRMQRHYAAAKVGSFPESDSPYGVSDMAGNVWEMTTGSFPTVDNPSNKAIRGGCFLNAGSEVRTTVRWAAKNSGEGAEWLGFRCVMDARLR